MRLFNSTSSEHQSLTYSKLALACLLALGTAGMAGCDKSTPDEASATTAETTAETTQAAKDSKAPNTKNGELPVIDTSTPSRCIIATPSLTSSAP